MAQTFDPTKPVSGVTKLSELYQIIRDHQDAIRSHFHGTELPPDSIAGQIQIRNVGGVLRAYLYDGSSHVDLTNALAEVVAARGSAASLWARLDTALNPDGTIKAGTPTGGWWANIGGTVAFFTAASFTVSGDQREVFAVNRAVRARLTSTYVYGYVSATDYDSGTGLTTVTLEMVDGALLTSALDRIEYGQEVANAPRGGTTIMPILDMGAATTIMAGHTVEWAIDNFSDYSGDVEFSYQVIRASDGADRTADFTIIQSGAALTVGHGAITSNTAFDFRFRALDKGFTWSAQSRNNAFDVDANVAPVVDRGAYTEVNEGEVATWNITNHEAYTDPTYSLEFYTQTGSNVSNLFSVEQLTSNVSITAAAVDADTLFDVSLFATESGGGQSYTTETTLNVLYVPIQDGETLTFDDSTGWQD